MQSRIVAVLLALALSVWGVSATAKPYRLGVAIEPTSAADSASARQRAFEQFARVLSERLQQPVTVLLTTPGDEATALELGTVDMALLKAVSYGRAKDRDSKISGLVTVVSRNENEEETTHSGYIVALKTSPIDKVSDIKGKRFGFVRNSASGLAYPIAYLSKQGLDSSSDFSQHVCYRNNEELIAALNAGKIDAGTTYRSPLLKRNSDLAHFKIIARISDIPNPLIAVSASLTQAEKQKLTAALTTLPESAFQGVGFFGLKAIDEKLYDPVVELGRLDVCG